MLCEIRICMKVGDTAVDRNEHQRMCAAGACRIRHAVQKTGEASGACRGDGSPVQVVAFCMDRRHTSLRSSFEIQEEAASVSVLRVERRLAGV